MGRFKPRVRFHKINLDNGSESRKLLGNTGTFSSIWSYFMAKSSESRLRTSRAIGALVLRCLDHLPILVDITFEFLFRSKRCMATLRPLRQYFARKKLIWRKFANFCVDRLFGGMLTKCGQILLLDEKPKQKSARKAGDLHTSARELLLF